MILINFKNIHRINKESILHRKYGPARITEKRKRYFLYGLWFDKDLHEYKVKNDNTI